MGRSGRDVCSGTYQPLSGFSYIQATLHQPNNGQTGLAAGKYSLCSVPVSHEQSAQGGDAVGGSLVKVSRP